MLKRERQRFQETVRRPPAHGTEAVVSVKTEEAGSQVWRRRYEVILICFVRVLIFPSLAHHFHVYNVTPAAIAGWIYVWLCPAVALVRAKRLVRICFRLHELAVHLLYLVYRA